MSEENIEETNVENEQTTCNLSDLVQENLKRAEESSREFKDKYLRTLAEMENMRKRLSQEKQESIAFALSKMLNEFLMPLDNFEMALAYTDNLSDELKNWAHGFKMIASQFRDVLETHGITRFDSLHCQFDPYFHEAIESVETNEYEDGTIIEEISKGYKHGERVLRHAKVKVAKRSES